MRIFRISKNKNDMLEPRPDTCLIWFPNYLKFSHLPHFGPPRSQMLDDKGAINFKLNKGLGGTHGDCGDAVQLSDTSESDDEATETNGPKED